MRGQYNYRDALSPNGIRSRSFRTRSATAERAAVPQVASCESRAWRSGSAIIPEGGLPNAMALIVRRCQPSGPSRSPKITVPLPLPFTVYRGVVRANYRYRTVKEYRKVLLRFIVEQPLSAERGRSLGWSRATSFLEWSSPDHTPFVWTIVLRVAVRHIVILGHRQTNYRYVRSIISFPDRHFENVKVTP
ncbi:hypothetical protein GEV33_004287 [Tenebrio molitor]|uniref:Uncharacterized protein n=1 Tax=Tenebrio molitor TaxID=7067 RepID=A0A8J6HPM7_TENMO|nr:hypothetical protein GEV33_004287 [Tenebrio molitor]